MFRLSSRHFNKVLRSHGLSAVQAHILVLLWLEGPMTIGQLQRELAFGSSTLTGAIDRMEKSELVRRRPVPGDRRAFRLEPARWPAARRERLIEAITDTEAACYGALAPREQKQLLRLLGKVSASLQADEEV
ncbi:MAG TPA: MarR family transcriptional regulator [Kofleriaceae bacterium]|nr:MarR family transcriptional regulator [Kofleriaceae bacterium]